MKEKFLKAIVLVMAAVMVFGMTTMMFSAAEIGDNVPTTTAKPTRTAGGAATRSTRSATARSAARTATGESTKSAGAESESRRKSATASAGAIGTKRRANLQRECRADSQCSNAR